MAAESLIMLIVGAAVLILGAEILVRGASRLASAIGISPLVIGLTVVAFGTSSPELAVSLQAGLGGEPDIALGNVFGSNIFNVLVILGFSALLTPLVVAQQLVRLEIPLMIGLSLLILAMAMDGAVSRIDGLFLTLGLIGYCVFAIRVGSKENRSEQGKYEAEASARAPQPGQWMVDGVLVLLGLGMLIMGSRWLVSGAVALAEALGVSKLVIGLTIIAAGTSLPEVATSVIAGLRGERDIAVGNVVGSCLFNLMGILGLASLSSPVGIPVLPSALNFDLPVMVAVGIACLPICFTGYRVGRREGLLLLAYYVAYTLYLILDSAGHDALPAFSATMAWFVIPITAVVLAIVTWQALSASRGDAAET